MTKQIEILGTTFNSEEEARQYYTEDLRKRLPELKQIEGFPIGEDEDILALSNPPFYTACPNPYINEFIEKYGKPYNEETDNYYREPFVGDVREGKNNPIYNAHTYHTKVPHTAIEKYIEHYTIEEYPSGELHLSLLKFSIIFGPGSVYAVDWPGNRG